MAGLAMGTMGAGAARWGGAGVVAAVAFPPLAAPMVELCGTLMAPAGGFPPTFGWWCEYHSFSTQLTTPFPPWPLAHSAKRAPTELPSAGLVRACPRDTDSHRSTATRAS